MDLKKIEPTNKDSSSVMDIDEEQNTVNKIEQPNNIDDNNEEESSVLASSTVNAPAISVSLHPLVIMNISEHWTRIKSQSGDSLKTKIIGALIGKQNGRNIEIMNSFELKGDIIESVLLIDIDFYRTKEAQFKQVFPEMEFLGWYTNGDTPNQSDMKIHRQILEINESPLFLKLNPMNRHNALPIKLFESVIDLVEGVPTMLFVDIPYALATEEAERIGLDHMARLSSSSGSGESTNSVVTEHLRVQYSAVKMLRDRIKLLLAFVRDTKNQTIPYNHEIMREILNLSHRLPLIIGDGFNEDFYIQCNDVSLITYLGTLTKCSNSINQFVNKFNILQDRQARRLRMG